MTADNLTLVNTVRSELQTAIDEVRAIARGIRPPLLDHLGLAAALDELAARVALPVDVEVPEGRWDHTVEAAVYYTVAESLTNTVKHSGATRARVRMAVQYDRLTFTIDDDGCGSITFTTGGGLLGLQDRITALGGTLTIAELDGGGSQLVAEPPTR